MYGLSVFLGRNRVLGEKKKHAGDLGALRAIANSLISYVRLPSIADWGIADNGAVLMSWLLATLPNRKTKKKKKSGEASAGIKIQGQVN